MPAQNGPRYEGAAGIAHRPGRKPPSRFFFTALAALPLACHHETIVNCDRWPDHMTVASFGPRTVCTACGSTGADVRPNWKEYQAPLM